MCSFYAAGERDDRFESGKAGPQPATIYRPYSDGGIQGAVINQGGDSPGGCR